MGRKRLTKTLAVVTGLFLMSAPSVWADVCVSDFDYDGNVYPSDLSVFLDEYGRIDCPPDGPAPVEWTGVTLCYDEDGYSRNCAGTGEDGEYQKGVDWPLPRFTDNGDGTATDK